MAETVKKSRIVSDEDENLEAALLEEFNTRLKHCMSQDDLQDSEIFDNPNTIAKPLPKNGPATNDFLQHERQHYYDVPSFPVPVKNGHEETEENIYETLPEIEKTETADQSTPEPPNLNFNLDLSPANDDAEPAMVHPIFSLNTSDFSEQKSPEEPSKSVKDRMFLMTDDAAATLLFTQTVTSPMLTPSEENIDFLKGFQKEPTSSEESNEESNRKDSMSETSDLLNSEAADNHVIYENTNQDVGNIYENLKEPVKENIYENLQDINVQKEELEDQERFKDHIYQEIEEYSSKDAKEEIIVENTLYHNFVETQEDIVTDLDAITEPVNNYEEIPSSEDYIHQIDSIENTTKESYSEFLYHSKTESNYYEKYTEVVSKNTEINNREKDTETVPAEIVKNLKTQFSKGNPDEVVSKKEIEDVVELKMVNIMKQINKFEHKNVDDLNEDSTMTETYTETTTIQSDSPEEKVLKKKKTKKSRKEEKENISVNDDVYNGGYTYNVNVKKLCRSFGDLTKIPGDTYRTMEVKYNGRSKSLSEVLLASNKTSIENVFAEVSVRALKEKFNIIENKNPLGIVKHPFKNTLSKSSFSKFDALQKKNVLHIRSSDSAKAQEKFNGTQIDTTHCKSCSKQVFQMEQIKAEKAVWHKNCFRCTECSKQLTVETYVSHEGNLYCKPHFKSLFAPKVVEDDAPSSDKPDLGLEELQSLNVKERFQVFEQHQSESQDIDRGPVNVKKSPSILSKLARFQAKGMDVGVTDEALNGIPIEESSSEEEEQEEEIPEGEDPTLYRAKKVQKEKPFHFTNLNEVKNKWEHGEQNSKDERREERKQEIQSIRNKLFLGKQGKMKEAYQQAIIQSESCTNMVKSEKIESCDTKTLKERFEKGQLQNEKEIRNGDEDDNEVFQSEISKKSRSMFLELDANAAKQPQCISPVSVPKLDVKKAKETDTPDREIYHDPEVIRSDENVDDSEVAKASHTASKMLSKFRQMEENLTREPEPAGPKPLKRFTPPPEPARQESDSGEESASDEEEEDDEVDQTDNQKLPEDLIEAQKAARAKQLRAKFEKWEAQEIKREQNQSVNIIEECGDESQVESTKSLRARFESMREISSDKSRTPRVKVNRFVDMANTAEVCESCQKKVYPLEKLSIHGHIYHKNCFKCMECSTVLRMDSYSYNQGLLFCTPHFKRLFISKGNYETGFGLNQHKEKWNLNATVA